MKIFRILTLFSIILLQNCVIYLSHLAGEQVDQFKKRERIDKVIANDSASPEEISKLRFIQDVKKFGIEHLALSEDSGFEYYVKLDRDSVGWNVSASYPLEFRSYTWWFPIAGEVPYKGYFDNKLALEEEKSLKHKGLDTRIRITGGYSTLGWFSDPVFSPQLQAQLPELAGLVFHEMTHATVYIPGDPVFNESYASFVETKGVELYYTNKDLTKDLISWKDRKDKKMKSIQLIRSTAEVLKKIYESDRSDMEKLKLKANAISEFKVSAIKKGFVSKENIDKFTKKDWNNEDFIGALRYQSGNTFFERVFQEAGGDFLKFHNLVKKYEKLSKEERKQILKDYNQVKSSTTVE
ncbi:aminopeptidase [Leptospira sp. GIMC2001]|uniref:aminopeptidase n=1 Tax=Leptospira sp. GIMC2001 TaxID=1513297 RepID=UPI00234B3F77|nr:aminopeptidase [Leptospira sp. GIMC2001]WCL50259.1 aminopeptidase [Leptospira sp. GIMC2001]